MKASLTDYDLLIPIISATLIMTLLAIFVIYFVLIYRKKQKELVLERKEYEQALLTAENEIKEQTLTNLSRELHDNFGQIASLLKINLSTLENKLGADEKPRVQESVKLVSLMIGEIRALSVSLKSNNIERYGLVKMIKMEVDRIQKISGLKILLSFNQEIPRLSYEKELFLYRMIQEVFNNILKHSKANKVAFNFIFKHNTLKICITDNGIGFDMKTIKKGSGLINLKERARMIEGTFEIESALKQGTTATIEIIE